MVAYAWGRSVVRVGALLVGMEFVAGCSLSSGPPRLYPVDDEVQAIRKNLDASTMTLADYSRLDETKRVNYRNDWIAARMYAIDLEYTGYEAALTKERQDIGFGAAATTIGLTTGSGLAASTVSKDILTGVAGAITGARAAYENDILFAHSVQWIQSQMRTQRTQVATRILAGMKLSTKDYPLAAALLDLEDYYRAGTFTGGMLGTTETLGEQAKLAELAKQERIEVTYSSTPASKALRACLLRKNVTRDQLVNLMPKPDPDAFGLMLAGQAPALAESILTQARLKGICP